MTLEKMLRYVVIGGAFLFPFIPFVVSATMFFPFITGKNFTFRILTEIIFAAWLVLAYLHPAYRPRKSFILWFLAAFVGIMALADAFGMNAFKSFWSNFERMEGLVTLIHLLMYFLAISSVFTVEKLWIRLASWSVGLSVVMIFYALAQKSGTLAIHQSGTRLDATLGNATYLAVYMIFHAFLTVLLIGYARAKNFAWLTWLLAPILFLQVLILYFTETRGAVLGFLGGSMLALLLYGVSVGGRARKYAIGSFLAMLVLVGAFAMVRDAAWIPKDGPLGRLATISLSEGNVRFMVWNMAWQGVKERPVLGWGQDGFNYVFNKHYNPAMYSQEPWFDRAHNVFMDWLVAGGFLGLFGYLALFGASLYYLWIYRKNGVSPFGKGERAVLTGLLVGYFFHNIFVFDNLVSYILFASVLAYLHVRATGYDTGRVVVDRARETTAYTVVAPIAFVLLVVMLYFVNVKGILTAQTLLKAITPNQTSLEENLKFFDKAYAYDGLGRQEVAEQYLMAALQIKDAQVSNEVKQKFLDKAVAAMEKELERTPNDARLLIFMASVYNGFGMHDKALPYAERALKEAPKKQYAMFELASSHLAKGELDQALNLAKTAYELAPKYNEARAFYAAMLIQSGKITEAEEVLKDGGGIVGINDDRILNALVAAKRFDLVTQIWQKRVAEDPQNAQKHISLAASYLNAGKRAEAVAEIRKAIELEPKFKEQGEYYIAEIQAGRNP